MQSSLSPLKFLGNIFIATMVSTMLFTPAARAALQCVETNGIKVMYPPNLNGGWDVKDSQNGIVLADDFKCITTGPITDIHIWGSWLNDDHGVITNFWIGIYDDVPAFTNFSKGQITPSHPGNNLLWQQSFGPGQFAEDTYGQGSESFYNPTNKTFPGGDYTAWYYCFYPTNPFVQQGTATAPTNYWLAVYAQLGGQTQQLFGWKTSTSSYNDAAVWGTVANGLPVGNWQSMTNVQTGQPINLAFKLTTPTNPPPLLVITCPSNITVRATSSAGAVVTFTAAASGGCPPINVICSPPSGSTFPIGTNTVNCTARPCENS